MTYDYVDHSLDSRSKSTGKSARHPGPEDERNIYSVAMPYHASGPGTSPLGLSHIYEEDSFYKPLSDQSKWTEHNLSLTIQNTSYPVYEDSSLSHYDVRTRFQPIMQL